MSKTVFYRFELIGASVILVASLGGLNAQQSTAEAVSIGNDDIGGVVTSATTHCGGAAVAAGEPSVGWTQKCSTRPTMKKNRRARPC